MLDYQIQPNTRRCCVSGRELRPGERYHSVLLDEGGRLVRRDYGADAWRGPPEGAFSFWTGRIPPAQGKRRPVIDDDLLLDCFLRLEGQADPGRVNFRYVLALLLMRRRRLRFEEQGSTAAALCLRCTRTGARYQVANPCLSEEEMAAVQEDVFRVLGWE